jgi:hypothetical protein
LALVIRQFVVGWGPVGAGGLAASITIIGLLSMVLGAKLWFDAFFLAVFQLKRPAPTIAVSPMEFEFAAEPREAFAAEPREAFAAEPREASVRVVLSGGSSN